MRYILILISSLLFCQCTEKIDVNLFDSPVQLVVEGYVTNYTAQHLVQLSWSSPYFSNSPPERVSGATVTIEDSEIVYSLSEVKTGIYISDYYFAGIPGRTYTLTIELEGETYTATSKMPTVQRIDSIGFFQQFEHELYYDIKLYSQEPSSPGDHYFWRVYKDYNLVSKNLTQYVFANDDLINGNYMNGIKVQTVEAKVGSRITLEMASITEEYYEYCLAIIKETLYADGPFESAPASIAGNITNGALGFFTACSLTSKSKYVTGVEK